MRDIDVFQLALGLVPPWMVVDAKSTAATTSVFGASEQLSLWW